MVMASRSFVQQWGLLAPISLFVIFPLTYVIGKLGFQFGPQILFIALRMFLSGGVLLAFHKYVRKGSCTFDKKDTLLFLQVAFFGIGAYIPEFWALKYVSVSKVALLFLSIPFFSALFEAYFATARITRNKIIGLVIGFSGLLPLIIFGSTENSFSSFYGITLPELVILLSAAGYSFGWVSVKKLVTERNYKGEFVNAVTMLLGGLLALVSSFFLEGWTGYTPPVTDWPAFLFYITMISAVGIICYSFYAFLLKYYSATMIAFSGFTEPFFAALYAWILLGETVTVLFFVSLGIVSFGLYIFYKEELRLTV
ncbi:MAG: DMT family transporter [Proteobacteria bacterium]|nr:DMT family transporter [Pseudomonadota bacterium]NBP14936.1 DMT family transporter [bacterium]